jgi:hypothetical protein
LAFSANFSLGTNGTQFALMEYSDEALLLSNFTTYNIHEELVEQLQNGIGTHGLNSSSKNLLERSEEIWTHCLNDF